MAKRGSIGIAFPHFAFRSLTYIEQDPSKHYLLHSFSLSCPTIPPRPVISSYRLPHLVIQLRTLHTARSRRVDAFRISPPSSILSFLPFSLSPTLSNPRRHAGLSLDTLSDLSRPIFTHLQGSYVGIHSTGFRDFLLKPELLRAISDLGFEHPSEVQQECIPQSILGMDVVCQAKSGMGKTAVFVLATLQQIEPVDGEVSVLVLCHTRELAYQIRNEYARFTKYMPDVRTGVIYGGTPVAENQAMLKDKAKCPHILVGTPGRMNALVRDKSLKVSGVKHFVIDECDKILEQVDMRRDVQDIFRATPHHKQVMMFSATLAKEVRPTCKKFMQNPLEIYVDDETKLTLHGLQQHYVRLEESTKNRKLNDLLDSLEFNQVIIFVKSISRANELDKLLRECNFPSICIHGGLAQEERIKRYQQFKNFEKRILVATDIFGRGIDVERVNVSISYDTPTDADSYLHRVGRAGRFGTKGLAIMFVSSDEDAEVLKQIQSRFEVAVPELPETIEASSYMNA